MARNATTSRQMTGYAALAMAITMMGFGVPADAAIDASLSYKASADRRADEADKRGSRKMKAPTVARVKSAMRTKSRRAA